MSEQATAWVTLIPSAKGFGAETERALSGQLPAVGARQGKRFGASFKSAALIGVAAFGAVAAAGIKAVSAFEEAESVSRKLNQTLGNMGKGGAADAVDKMTTTLERQTGVDDDLIRKGETLLATFSEVAKSAGDTGGIFERATKASVDLSAAGFGSVESASVQLGKALQDPVKGITALNRSGVTFTATQKEQIKNFVATGDVASAQNLILKEVEKQVKGTAEAGAKSSDKLKNALGDANEALGGLIADLFDQGKGKNLIEQAADATNTFGDAVKKFQKSKDWKELKSGMKSFGGDVKTVSGALGKTVGYMDKLSKKGTGSGLLHWINEIDKKLNPLRVIADELGRISDLWDKIKGKQTNNPGPSGQGRDLTVDDLLGGPLASGGRNVTGGLHLVGERGPEIVSIPQGSNVYSNGESRRMLAGGASREFVLRSGALDIRNGKAYITGIISEQAFAAGLSA